MEAAIRDTAESLAARIGRLQVLELKHVVTLLNAISCRVARECCSGTYRENRDAVIDELDRLSETVNAVVSGEAEVL